jgi:hypothetical protein
MGRLVVKDGASSSAPPEQIDREREKLRIDLVRDDAR